MVSDWAQNDLICPNISFAFVTQLYFQLFIFFCFLNLFFKAIDGHDKINLHICNARPVFKSGGVRSGTVCYQQGYPM